MDIESIIPGTWVNELLSSFQINPLQQNDSPYDGTYTLTGFYDTSVWSEGVPPPTDPFYAVGLIDQLSQGTNYGAAALGWTVVWNKDVNNQPVDYISATSWNGQLQLVPDLGIWVIVTHWLMTVESPVSQD